MRPAGSRTGARSPLIAPRELGGDAQRRPPARHTAAELTALLGLLNAQHPPVRTVAVGHSRDDASRETARAFVEEWSRVAGRSVLAVVDWPEQAASWLRAARRLTAETPDAWVVAAAPLGWAQLARRLTHSTGWDARRTFGFASLAVPDAVSLSGSRNLDGLRVVDAGGGAWAVRDGLLIPACRGVVP
ncbi:hypothetical protein [Streptacidiphilus anmyonensis]|uniref:hypothetical protein n=1 Tax=Streptacidiphilus anmyonensis TaxID=405782 RepID=UPI000694EB17|nr:hypothetical protein [Streptacidiphilus anmyonensis]